MNLIVSLSLYVRSRLEASHRCCRGRRGASSEDDFTTLRPSQGLILLFTRRRKFDKSSAGFRNPWDPVNGWQTTASNQASDDYSLLATLQYGKRRAQSCSVCWVTRLRKGNCSILLVCVARIKSQHSDALVVNKTVMAHRERTGSSTAQGS
jgi:hypothetical protein